MTADRSFPDGSSTSPILQPERWEWLTGVSQRSNWTSSNSWRKRTGSNERPFSGQSRQFCDVLLTFSLFARRRTSVSCQSALVNTTDRDTRFGGLDGHNKSAQSHPGGVLSQR